MSDEIELTAHGLRRTAGRDVLHVLSPGVFVSVIGRHIRLTVDGKDKVLTLADAARLGKVLVSLGEGE